MKSITKSIITFTWLAGVLGVLVGIGSAKSVSGATNLESELEAAMNTGLYEKAVFAENRKDILDGQPV